MRVPRLERFAEEIVSVLTVGKHPRLVKKNYTTNEGDIELKWFPLRLETRGIPGELLI